MSNDYSKRLDHDVIDDYFFVKSNLIKFDLSNVYNGAINYGKEMDSESD